MLMAWLKRWTLRHARPAGSGGGKALSCRPRLEALEDRTLPAAGLREQYLLELINRMRMNPAAELPLLLNSTDPNVQNALSYFNVSTTLLQQQWVALVATAPLAWNDILGGTATAHS